MKIVIRYEDEEEYSHDILVDVYAVKINRIYVLEHDDTKPMVKNPRTDLWEHEETRVEWVKKE